MNKTYRIRPAVAADIESVGALDRTIQNVPHWTIAGYLAALAPADPAPNMPGTRRCFFVAETASLHVGFSIGRVTVLETEVLAELETVAVSDSARRAGIGQALCTAVMRWAHEQGATEIELEVRSRSDGAIALYRKLGFVAAGARARYYRDPVDDAVVMRFALADEPPPGTSAGRDL